MGNWSIVDLFLKCLCLLSGGRGLSQEPGTQGRPSRWVAGIHLFEPSQRPLLVHVTRKMKSGARVEYQNKAIQCAIWESSSDKCQSRHYNLREAVISCKPGKGMTIFKKMFMVQEGKFHRNLKTQDNVFETRRPVDWFLCAVFRKLYTPRGIDHGHHIFHHNSCVKS